MKNEKVSRVRNWTVVIYPDSAPVNWRDIIDEWHIEWVESPMHDKDIDANGEPKKPHIHVLLMFGGVKSYEQVLELIQPLHSPIPVRVHNVKSLVRYMSHLDNPDKAQYDSSLIVAHGGVDVADLLKPSSGERYTYIKEMQAWCNENGIVEFCDLLNYAAAFRFDDWFPLLCDNSSYVLNQFLKSKRHSYISPCVEDPRVVDYETGEILGE